MPELPDITVYIEALEKRILGQRLERVRIVSPFLLRTVAPLESAFGKNVVELRRLGKRICIGLENEIWLVLHLMIAGRLHWSPAEAKKGKAVSRNGNFAAFDFANGSVMWSEAGSQKRASLHVMAGEEGLRELDPGGLEVLESDGGTFAKVLLWENHTLKRALTDPTLFGGIGNAYSDEILWEARLSPMALTQKLGAEEIQRLHEATKNSLNVPAGDGGAREIQAGVSAMWDGDSADQVRFERDELLSNVPVGREIAGGPGVLEVAARRLAADPRRA
jgi:formamidopyrimidine-DNA glycosylase